MKKTLEQELLKAAEFTNNEPLYTEKELLDLIQFSALSTHTGSTLFWRMVMIGNIILSALTLSTLIPMEYSENPMRALQHPKESKTEMKAADSLLKSKEENKPLFLPEQLKSEQLYSPTEQVLREMGIESTEGTVTFSARMAVEKNNLTSLLDIMKKNERGHSTTTLNTNKLLPILHNYGYDTTKLTLNVDLTIHVSEFEVSAELEAYKEERNNVKTKPIMITHDFRFEGKNNTSVLLFNDAGDITNKGIKTAVHNLFTGKSSIEKNEILMSLVPIRVPIKETKSTLILWYYPTEHINKTIPEEVRDNIDAETIIANNSVNSTMGSYEEQGERPIINIDKISPNPAQFHATVSISTLQSGEIKLGVYSLEGNLLMELPTLNAEKGSLTIPMDLQLMNGVYLVVAANGNGVQAVTRLVINK